MERFSDTRLDSLRRFLPDYVDAALITTEVNRLYFTSFAASDGFLLVTRDSGVFFTDSRYIEAAQKAIGCCEVREGKKVFAQMADYLNARNVKSVAVEASGMTVAEFESLKKRKEFFGFNFVCDSSLDDAISSLRSVKSADEVERIKKAQAIAEEAFSHILTFIKPGVTEKQIQLELDFYMLSHGAQKLSFDTIAVSGVNSSMPHGVASDKIVEVGDFVTMDFGAVSDGYHSDMTRTIAVGKVGDEQRKIYDIVLRAQTAAIEALREGVRCADADKAARGVIVANGYGEYFGHSTGHGVGVEIHEKPNVSPNSNAVLQSGNIVTAEPGIYIPGKFGVRIEDMLLVTPDGSVNLTKADKSLIVV